MREKIDCEVCRKLYKDRAERNPDHEQTEPPCKECMPELMEENVDALRVYLTCQDQLILAPMGGIVAINHLAVWEYIRMFRIPNPTSVFTKVIRCASHIIKKINDEAKEETESGSFNR